MNRPAVLRRIVLAGIVAAGGCGDNGEASPEGERLGPPPTTIETRVASEGSIAREVTVTGVVEPIRTIGINSQLSGAVVQVNVEEGDPVRAGQVLARIDDRELRAQVASAQAAFEVAEAAFQRSERLRDQQVITAAEYERDRAAYAAAEATLVQLQTRLGYATVNASGSGVVTERFVEDGDIVAAQTRLFTVGDLSTMVVRVPVSELDVVDLSEGEDVSVALDAFPGRVLAGRIRRIFPSADPATRLVPVEVTLVGEGSELARPGFLARVTFALGARDDVLLVPASAVVGETGAEAVFVVREDRALRREVEIGATSQGQVEIVSGLSPGEAVVVTGNNALRDGAPVRVVAPL